MRSKVNRGMRKSSMAELRVQIAAGEYAVDSRELAGDILAKLAVIRPVSRWLMTGDEEGAADESRRAAQTRNRRGARPAPPQRPQLRSDRLP